MLVSLAMMWKMGLPIALTERRRARKIEPVSLRDAELGPSTLALGVIAKWSPDGQFQALDNW